MTADATDGSQWPPLTLVTRNRRLTSLPGHEAMHTPGWAPAFESAAMAFAGWGQGPSGSAGSTVLVYQPLILTPLGSSAVCFGMRTEEIG